jgi:hypothetical protein
VLLEPRFEALGVEAVVAATEHALLVFFVVLREIDQESAMSRASKKISAHLQANCAALFLLEPLPRERRNILVHCDGAGRGDPGRNGLSCSTALGHGPFRVLEDSEGGDLVGGNALGFDVAEALGEAEEGVVGGIELVVIL